ncbi:unnamed protein product, partial [Polarella glacialis]
VGILRSHVESAYVQDAGLCRIGWLCTESKDKDSSEILGLTAPLLMPAIQVAMRGLSPDPGIQRAGCGALRGLSAVAGQLPAICQEFGGPQLIVEAMKVHLKIVDVVTAGNQAISAMSQKAGKNSPELSIMRQAGCIEALQKVMTHHAWDQTLCGRIRVVLPFLTED